MPSLAPVELCLAPEADPASVLRALAGSLPVRPGPTRSEDHMLLDSFDGRLRSRGWTAWQERRSGADPTLSLTLECPPDAAVAGTARPARADRILVGEVAAGPLRDRLEPVLEERALLPLVRVRTRTQLFNVCNRDAKTVVRLSRLDPEVVAAGRQIRLRPRLRVVPVLGYDREFARVISLLTRKGGLDPLAGLLAEEAVLAAGREPPGVPGRPDEPMDPAMASGQAMLRVCRRMAEVVEANLAGTVEDLDPEFLHDLRVAVRRTRSVLKEMRGVLPAEVAGRSRTDLRWIQEITGPTRDLDVLLHSWTAMTSPVPASMSADLEPLERLLARLRADAFAAMRRQLRGRRFRDAWEAWTGVLAAESSLVGPAAGRPVGEMAAGRIVSVYRSMVKAGSAIDDTSAPEALHDLRKRGKELRYLLELFGGMWPARRVKPLVAGLKGLQDVLGRFQDDEIQVARLRGLAPDLAAAPGGTDSLIALGFVLDGLSADQRLAREAFAARFADFAGPPTRSLVQKTFLGSRSRR